VVALSHAGLSDDHCMEAGGDQVKVSIELVMRVDDPIATAAFLLGPDPEHTAWLSLPPPAPLDAQVRSIVRETILDRLRSDAMHTGLVAESVRVSAHRLVPPTTRQPAGPAAP